MTDDIEKDPSKFKKVFGSLAKTAVRSSRTLTSVDTAVTLARKPKSPNETRLGNLGKTIQNYALDKSNVLRTAFDLKDFISKSNKEKSNSLNGSTSSQKSGVITYLKGANQYTKSLKNIEKVLKLILFKISDQDNIFKEMLRAQQDNADAVKKTNELNEVERHGNEISKESHASGTSNTASHEISNKTPGGFLNNLFDLGLKYFGYAGLISFIKKPILLLFSKLGSAIKKGLGKIGPVISEMIKPTWLENAKKVLAEAEEKAVNASRTAQIAADEAEAASKNAIAKRTASEAESLIGKNSGKELKGAAETSTRTWLQKQAAIAEKTAQELLEKSEAAAKIAITRKMEADLAKKAAETFIRNTLPKILGKGIMFGLSAIGSTAGGALMNIIDPNPTSGSDTTDTNVKSAYSGELYNMGYDGTGLPNAQAQKFINEKSKLLGQNGFNDPYLNSPEHKRLMDLETEIRNKTKYKGAEARIAIESSSNRQPIMSPLPDANANSILKYLNENGDSSNSSAPVIINNAPVTNNIGGSTNINNGGNVVTGGGGHLSLMQPQLTYNLPSLVY